MFVNGACKNDGYCKADHENEPLRLDVCDSERDNNRHVRAWIGLVGFGDGTMAAAKSSDELYNEQRRQRAAELIAAIVRKRRRATTDEALLDQEALRTAAERADQNELKHVG
jgi:hypothetical protein